MDLTTAKATPPQLSTAIPHLLQQTATCFDQL
jgi:pre-mRNA-processing factor 19